MKSASKPLILSPQDSISDIIYQIKSYVLKQEETLIYIPEEMYLLYNTVNRGLFVHTIKQLMGRYRIELFTGDHSLAGLLQSENIQISTSDEPTITATIQGEDANPYMNFFQELPLSHNNSSESKEPSLPEPLFDTPIEGQQISSPKKTSAQKSPSGSFGKWMLGIFFLLLFSLVGAAIAIPQAEVKITANTESLSKDFDISFDPTVTDISVENRTIPSKIEAITASVEGTYEGTGTQSGQSRASATITIVNETSSSQQLVEKTRFLSDSGKQFRLSKTVNVPAKGEVKGEIIADGVGESYNIKAGKLTIPGLEDNSVKFKGIYGNLERDINNGALEDSSIVTEEDITKARLDLQKQLSEVINKQISERKDTQSLVVESKLTDITYTGLPSVGDKSRSFTVKATTSTDGVFYQEDDLNRLMKSLIETQVLDSKSLNESIEITFDKPEQFSTKEAVKTRVYVKYSLNQNINSQEIANVLRLKPLPQAKEYMKSIDGVSNVDIQLNPSFMPILPVINSRIRIIVE